MEDHMLYEARKYYVMISTDLCLVPDVFNIQVNKYYGMIWTDLHLVPDVLSIQVNEYCYNFF